VVVRVVSTARKRRLSERRGGLLLLNPLSERWRFRMRQCFTYAELDRNRKTAYPLPKRSSCASIGPAGIQIDRCPAVALLGRLLIAVYVVPVHASLQSSWNLTRRLEPCYEYPGRVHCTGNAILTAVFCIPIIKTSPAPRVLQSPWLFLGCSWAT
jgi:hypothetical protein